MPAATKISAPFWQALKENKLKIQQCNSCDGWIFFPRNHCSHCLAHDLDWKQVNGDGILYSYTLARIPTMPEFSDEMPPAFAGLVKLLNDGFCLSATTKGLNNK